MADCPLAPHILMAQYRLSIAVRELVEYALRSGDLNLTFVGSGRNTEAIRAHQKVQKSRPESYAPEVSISHEIETPRFLLSIGGRIDGIYHHPDRVIIDEIKTTTRDPAYFHSDDFQQNENPFHWGQVRVYAYFYAASHNLDTIEAQLTYYHLDTGEMREFRRSFTTADLEIFFNELVARYLEWAETLANWCRVRDDSIQNLKFPFADYRPGQRDMAVAVYRTIRDRKQLIVQAATGIGKTMGAIFPAVKAIGEQVTSKIFYLTARTTGRIAAEKAFDELRAGNLRIKSLTLTAKDKICFNPESACHPDECEFAKGHYDRLNDALKSIFQQDALTREAIEATARSCKICPFEFSLDLSLWADCVICDYNYAFDPRVFLRRFFAEGSGDYTFLADEAHNLVDRAREMFSAQIFKTPFLEIRRELRDELPGLYRQIGKINAWLVRARKKCQASGREFLTEKDAPEDLCPLLKGFLRMAERWLALNIKAPFREGLLDLYFSVSRFVAVSDQYDENYATCFEPEGRNLGVKLFCTNPSGQLRDALKRCKSVTFFSATMTPGDYFRTLLGCEAETPELRISSPFPPQNLGVFVSDRISTYYKDRKRTKADVAKTLATLANERKGNYLFFFPSYEYLRMVSELFARECPEIQTLIQRPGMAESERVAFLETFAAENPNSLVGFTVMGGIFGEGIDLKGDRLAGAVIVGVGLPGICPERELIRAHFEELSASGFAYAYLYPGINRVLQAAGRVIRTEKDQGVVLLIDQRFSTFRYRSLLPQEWQAICVRSPEAFGNALEKFWERVSLNTHTAKNPPQSLFKIRGRQSA